LVCALCAPLVKWNSFPADIRVFAVFFSTFEFIGLTQESCMQRKGVPMLYERSATVLPTLYVCQVENVLGRVPLIQCYLNDNTLNTHYLTSIGDLYLQRQLQIQVQTVEQGSVFSRSTSGCGATGEHFHARLQYQTL
jgi:hypothetical protein